jgi:mycothiol system anti-sigma-R factor
MQDCQAMGRIMHAYLDGELRAREIVEIQYHLDQCPDCALLYRNEKLFLDLIKESLPSSVAPDALKQKVRRALKISTVAGRVRSGFRLVGVPVLAVTVLVLLVAGIWVMEKKPVPDLVSLAVDTHQEYLNQNVPLDIKSRDPIQVGAWFQKRTDFPVLIGHNPVKNLTLVGGRLIEMPGKKVVFLAYEMGQHRLTLVMTASQGINLFGAKDFMLQKARFYQSTYHGYKTLSWAQEGMAYVFVSDQQEINKKACLICHGHGKDQKAIKGLFDKGI